MLDTTAHADSRLPLPAPTITPTASAVRAPAASGMDEPGIFKGCRAVDGPLPEATKRAILAYLGKPNAAGWERLKPTAIVGGTTLADAWAIANPSAARRFPTSAELIRSLRVAVIAQWAGSAVGPLNTH